MAQVWVAAPARRQKADGEKLFKLVGILFGLAVCLVGAVIACLIARQEGDRPFSGHMSEYLAPVQGRGTLRYGDVKGKMVVVDVEARKVDPIQFDLPERLRARSHAQVQYIARLKWEKVLNGYYVERTQEQFQVQEKGPRVAAIRWDCQVELVERATGRRATQRIVGGSPETIRRGQDPSGPKRTDLVLAYLEQMAADPRQ